MSSASAVFDENYYRTVYRNYSRQNPPRKLNFYRELVAGHLGNPQRAAVLDIGCAFGAFLGALPSEWDRYGIDVNAYGVEQAKAHSTGIQLANAALEESPFQGPFDAITAFEVVEHIPDIDGTRERIYRLLKPGGVFVFVVPVYDGPLGWVVEALDKDPTHIHKTGREFWLSWASQSFHVEKWMGAYRYLTPIGVYLHYKSRPFRRWSPAIAVVARRTGR